MNARSWLEGYTRLQVAFPDRDMTPEQSSARSRVYRESLDDLHEGQWLHAVDAAIRLRTDTFFPAAGLLREYAEQWVPPERPRLSAGACGACDGSGWEHYDKGGHMYARRCTCVAPRLAG